MTSDTDLGAVATADLADVTDLDGTAVQGAFEGTDYHRVTFTGVRYDSLTLEAEIGDEMTFLVRGRVKGVGDQQMNDGHIRHEIKVDVHTIALEEG